MSEIKAKLEESWAQLTGPEAPWATGKETIDGVDYTTYTNAPKTLKELIDAGRAHGDNEFLIFEDDRLSFNQYFAKVDQLTAALQNEFGIKKGDRVAIAMRNYPEWMIAFSAATMTGAVVVPLNSWGKTAELEYGIKDSGASIIFMDEQRFGYIANDLENLGIKAIVVRPKHSIDASNAIEFDTAVNMGEGLNIREVEMNINDVAMIMYTSGTTGNPKGAVSNHRNVCQSIFNFECAAIVAAMSDPEPIGKMLERGYPPKVLLAVPLFHVSGCHSVFLLSLRSGRPIVIMYKWDRNTALELIEKERITMISAVPTMLVDMLDAPEWNNYDTSSMFGFGAGGSAQPPQLADKIYSQLPDSFPGTGYGMTETNATGFAVSGSAYKQKPKSTGTKTAIVDVRILDESGNELKQGEHGEIQLKTPTAVQGYWNKPEATEETFVDGWVITGDIGYLDEEGFLFITDRIKDMIIRGGENIYSAEIEASILSNEDIQEVAAFGIPDEKMGEELAVVIVLKEGKTATAEDIQAHVASQLAKFKVPKFVHFDSTPLPRNATMKVLKKPLKEKYS